jgi:hypothetical protein
MRRWSDPVVWMVEVFFVLGAFAPKQEEPQKAPIYDPVVMQQQPAASEPQPAPEPIKIGALFSVTAARPGWASRRRIPLSWSWTSSMPKVE